MKCKYNTFYIKVLIDNDNRLIEYDSSMISCGLNKEFYLQFREYCKGKTIEEVLHMNYSQALLDLRIKSEEMQYMFYLQISALKSAIAQYLGSENEEFDKDRCQIDAIKHNENGIEINGILLPPKALPEIV